MILSGIFNQSELPHLYDAVNSLYRTLKKKSHKLRVVSHNNFRLLTDQPFFELNYNSGKTLVLAIGNLFSQKGYRLINQTEFFKIVVNNSFKEISEFFKGDYILIKIEDKSIQVIRPAFSNTSIFFTEYSSRSTIFANEISYIYQLMKTDVSFSQNYLLQYLLSFNTYQSSSTPFDNILELVSGSMLIIGEKTLIQKIWEPKYECSNWRDKVSKLPEILEDTIKWQTHGIPEKKIVIELSGGLDSSSILFSLRNIYKNSEISAFNVFHPDFASCDERHYALQASKNLNTKLHEINFAAFMPFSDVSQSKYLPNKLDLSLIKLKLEDHISEIFPRNNGYVFLSGEGGDHIFNSMPDLESLADVIIDNKLSLLFSKIKDLAMFHRMNLGCVSSETLQILKNFYFSKVNFDYSKQDAMLFNENLVLPQNIYNIFYEELIDKKILPGKLMLFEGLNMAQEIISSLPRKNQTFYPFITRGIVETALLIPTYLSYGNGYDRYLFREVMYKKFKNDIFWRKNKSEIVGVYSLGFRQNFDFILDLCMNGWFVKNKIINKTNLEKAIRVTANNNLYQKQDYADINVTLCSLFVIEYFIYLWAKNYK